jgi:antitoxin ParD1/3/4
MLRTKTLIRTFLPMSSPLPPELQHFVDRELASGKYRSADEVICEGLRLLRERRLYEVRKEIDAGLRQLERGEGTEIEDERALAAFFEDIKRRGRERLEAHESGK